MARIRTIKPEFWSDYQLARDLDRDQRLLYIGLWNEADDEGRLLAHPRRLLGAIFPYDRDLDEAWVDHALEALCRTGRAVRYSIGGEPYLQLTKFSDHQRINRPSRSRIPPPDNDLAVIWPNGLDPRAKLVETPPENAPESGVSTGAKSLRTTNLTSFHDTLPANREKLGESAKSDKITPKLQLVGPHEFSPDSVRPHYWNREQGTGNREISVPDGTSVESARADADGVPVREMWDVFVEELGGQPPHPRLTPKRKGQLTALYREQLQRHPRPLELFRDILRAVQRSDHHMATRSYQMPESLFRNPERRDSWTQRAVAANAPPPRTVSSIGSNQGRYIIEE